jgi:uncharacterized GH25 family protein
VFAPSSASWSLRGVPAWAQTLVASRLNGSTLAPDRLIVRRDVQIPATGPAPVLDFAGREAVVPATGKMTVANGGGDLLTVTTALQGQLLGAGVFAVTSSTGGTNVLNYAGLPDSLLAPGELHELTAVAQTSDGTGARVATVYARGIGDRALTLGAGLPAATVTMGPGVPLRASVGAVADYPTLMLLLAQQPMTQGTRTIVLSTSAAYAGTAPATWTATFPDLTGVTGFDASWAPASGARLDWAVSLFAGPPDLLLGVLPFEGRSYRRATRYGSIGGSRLRRPPRSRRRRSPAPVIRPPRARTLRSRFLLAGAALLVGGAGVALAHDTWLLPSRASVPPGQEVAFDLTSGTAFPASGTAIAGERVSAARVRLAGREDALPAPAAAARALRFRAPLGRAGIATVWVDLAPRELQMAPAAVAGYLAEIGAPDSVRAAYEAPPEGARRWRERYAKHAKSVVRVASPQRALPPDDSSWRAPTGQALELVPDADPTALRAGDRLRVRLLAGGAAVPFHAVGVVGGGTHGAHGAHGAQGTLVRTDAAGRATVPLPRAGRWLLRATLLRRAGDPALDWESDFATLTVAVGVR